MSAERGWIGEPQPPQEWHTPGWLSEKGTGRSHFHSDKYAAKQEEEWRDSHYSRQADRVNAVYHALPDDSLNILREPAGLDPLPEDEPT